MLTRGINGRSRDAGYEEMRIRQSGNHIKATTLSEAHLGPHLFARRDGQRLLASGGEREKKKIAFWRPHFHTSYFLCDSSAFATLFACLEKERLK